MFLRGECRAQRSVAFAYYDDIVCVAHWRGIYGKGSTLGAAYTRCQGACGPFPKSQRLAPLSGDREPQLELYALAVSAVSGRCAAAVKLGYLPHDIKAQPEMRLMLRALLTH